MTKRADDLSVFVAPRGQFFNSKVWPSGLAHAPATFQDHMNQVLQGVKQKTTVQELLTRGAFIEGYVDDLLLRAGTVEAHVRLVEECLRTCDEAHTKIKVSKCEFMEESRKYLGFEVSWRW